MTVERLTAAQLPPAVVQRLNQATLIASPRMAALWRPLGGRDVYWCAMEGGEIAVALTAVEFGIRPLKRLQAMPDGLYARPVIVSEGANIDSVMPCLMTAISTAGYARVFINDYFGVCDVSKTYAVVENRTTVINIASPDWQPPDPKIQSEIRKAEREGVTATAFDTRDMDEFLFLMESTEVRHGRDSKYPEVFWRGLADLARVDRRVQWVNIVHEGKLAASHIYFVEGEMLLHWQAFFDKKYSFLKPNQYLMYTTARTWVRHGVTMLNQGASPSDATGLVEYKLKWGGTERRYRCLVKRSGLGRWL